LFRGLRSSGVYRAQSGWRAFAGMLLLANTVMAGALYLALAQFGDWFAMSFMTRSLTVLAICGLGFVTYAVTLLLCGFRLGQLRSPVK